MSFHARIDGSKSWRAKSARHYVQDLGIDRIAHSFIGDEFTRGLSGGEKRRVSIATELLTSPG
jgi:ATP-binding cassette subfamily G (WHITE) protein 2